MKVRDLDDRFQCTREAEQRSLAKLEELERLNKRFQGTGIFVCINGSLARKELVRGSDFDAFVIKSKQSSGDPIELWNLAERAAGLAQPGSSGTFGEESTSSFDEMVSNIGGVNDTNGKITQRMLLLLESYSVGDKQKYNELIDAILYRYISDNITDHQLALFLLNDIIRYYRTICVDFEFKTSEESKPWGIRNIKLIFSRKVIYFSGLLMCAETVQRTAIEKRNIIKRMSSMTPIERILYVLGEKSYPALIMYDRFLGQMNDDTVREKLKSGNREELRKTELFRSMKNDGHHFGMALRSSFLGHYDSSHPIHRAIMF